MTGKKWTKTDIKRLIQALDSWALLQRDFYKGKDFASDIVALLALGGGVDRDNRQKVIVYEIRSLGVLARDRAGKNQATADHARAFPAVWGEATQEIIDRFERFAREEDRASLKAEALARRVEAEGLPEEVQNYVPLSRFTPVST